jgi:hypothetical protein
MKMTNDIIIHVHQEISEFRSEIQSQLEEFSSQTKDMRNDIDTLSKRYDDEMKAVRGETRNILQDLQSMHLYHQRQTATMQHQVEECSCQGIVIK